MYEYATAIALDIGRTMIRTSIVRHGGEIISDFTFCYDEIPDRDQLVSLVIDAVRKTRTEASALKMNPLCTGIAVKGFVDHLKGIVSGPDQGIKGWKDVALAKLVNSATSMPVFIDNDAKLMAIAEQYKGAARGFNNIIFVALRSGIGGAIIIDGKLYRGAGNAGGEIGQMSIDMSGKYSEKGIRGSFESLASSVALVHNYLVMSGRINDRSYSVNKLLRARDVFEKSAAGDPYAIKAVKDNATYIGAGLANLVNIFSPDVIILGGGMAMAGDKYLQMIRDSVTANSLEYCHRHLKIIRAKLAYHSSLQGAGIYALTRLDGKHI